MLPSILYRDDSRLRPPLTDRRFAADIHLERVFASVCAGSEELDLWPILYSPLTHPDDVAYRHEVLGDLEQATISAAVKAFGQALRHVRRILAAAARLRSPRQRERLSLDAVLIYCGAVRSLAATVCGPEPRSRGMRAFARYLDAYCAGPEFGALAGQAGDLTATLEEIRYTVHIDGGRVTVAPYKGEPDFTEEVEAVFAKFRGAAVVDHRAALPDPLDVGQVEGHVLDLVARLNPGPFTAMEQFCRDHQDFIDPVLAGFDRAAQFYLSYLRYIEPLRARGLAFCLPRICPPTGRLNAQGAFDLALAAGVAAPRCPAPEVVTNDFRLGPEERTLVVTGPNNGGKTTFARALGQICYLASLGLPVPAGEAEVFLAGEILTSFEQTEQPGEHRSHLEDELVRLHEIVERASPTSVVLLNESFSSTTAHDAAILGRAVLADLAARGALCICVTFVDELATAGAGTVSMVATVHPDDPALRTYKVVRKPPDGLAYAAAIAERYRLSTPPGEAKPRT